MPPGPFGKQLPGSASGATCLLGWAPLGRIARLLQKVKSGLAGEGIPDWDSASASLVRGTEPMSLNAPLALLGYRIAGAIEMGVVAGCACEPMKRC